VAHGVTGFYIRNSKMDKRRDFIKKSIVLSGSCIFGLSKTSVAGSKNIKIPSITHGAPRSRVVVSHRSDLRTTGNNLSGIHLLKLLDSTVENLFQSKSQNVWKSLFSSKDIVGLKVNCLAGRGLSTRIEVVEAVIERLLEAGIKRSNIIIWDRHDNDLLRAGYKLYKGGKQVQCYGTNRVGYTSNIYEYESVGSQLSRIIQDQCTAVINLPILKDHGIVGMSAGLKNFFGAINNPNKYHDNVGNPFVADVNMLPAIRRKTRLTICDAITAQYEGGPPYMPQWAWNMDSLIAAVDMVALDQICRDIIEDKRQAEGFPSLKEANREPVYIATAADSNHRLGTNDHDKIELLRV